MNPVSDPKYNVISINGSIFEGTSYNALLTGWSLAEYSYEKTGLKLSDKNQQNAIIWLRCPKNERGMIFKNVFNTVCHGNYSLLSSDNYSSSNQSVVREGAYSVKHVNEILGRFICIE